MIDSTAISGSTGRATALRDRPSCVIPVQPNRSLPVRPVPNIPCRTVQPRRPGSDDAPTEPALRINADWQTRVSCINIIEDGRATKRKTAADPSQSCCIDLKRTGATYDHSCIDISDSPDRNDEICSTSVDASSCSQTESLGHANDMGPIKKRRRKREKRVDDPAPSKIVPPLRLKKISSLQEHPEGTNSSFESNTPTENFGFQYYLPSGPASTAQDLRMLDGNEPKKYEIVADDVMASLTDHPAEEKDTEKQRCRNTKLKTKLRELRHKMYELSREIMRSTQPNAEMFDRENKYAKQIETITNLLKALPEAVCDDETKDMVNSVSSQAFSGNFSLQIPSPEPPKLSPKIVEDFTVTNSPRTFRESPPVLANVWADVQVIQDLNERRSVECAVLETSSNIITTTAESVITEEVDLDEKDRLLNLSLASGLDLDKFNVAEETRDMIKLDLERSPSPGEMIIDTTSAIQEFSDTVEAAKSPVKTQKVDESDEKTSKGQNGDAAASVVSPVIITSSCDVQPIETHKITGENGQSMFNTEQFLTLGDWLTKITVGKDPRTTSKTERKKKANQTAARPQLDNPVEYRLPAQTHSEFRGVQASEGVAREPAVPTQSQWRAEGSREQGRATPLTSQQMPGGVSHVTEDNLSASASQGVPQYYSAVSLNRLCPQNYPFSFQMDPNMMPYNYNQMSMNGVASFWNPLMQYPIIRSRNVAPQYAAPPPAAASPVPASRPPPPSYTYTQSSMGALNLKRPSQNSQSTFENAAKRSCDYQQYRPLSTPLQGVSGHQQAMPPPQMHQQYPPQQLQYDRGYAESAPRMQMTDPALSQLNYRASWSPRGPMMPPVNPPTPRYHSLNSSWTADPRNLLSTLSPATLQGYRAAMSISSVLLNPTGPKDCADGSRVCDTSRQTTRNLNDRRERLRNCETPHLGKVNYSPNSSMSLRCCHCGAPEPRFNCLGCEVAFYCNERCQASHWSRHVTSCPKKMPRLQKVVP